MRNVAILLILGWLLLSGLRAQAASPLCGQLEQRIRDLQEETQSLRLQLETLHQIEQTGDLPEAGLRSVIPVLLSSDDEIRLWWQGLQAPLAEPSHSAAESVNCENTIHDLQAAWQEQNRYREAFKTLIKRWIDIPRNLKLSLVRSFQDEDRLVMLRKQISQEVADGNAALAPLQDWTTRFRYHLGHFISATLRGDLSAINEAWRQAHALPRPSGLSLNETSARPDDPTADLLESLHELRRDLRLSTTIQRNNTFLQDGGPGVFTHLTSDPAGWLSDLVRETTMVPAVMLDQLTGELVRQYEQGLRQQQRLQILSAWALELVLLALILWGLQFLARWLPVQLAQWQQALMASSRSAYLLGAIRNLFWFLKPNAQWLVLLVGSRQLAKLVPAEATVKTCFWLMSANWKACAPSSNASMPSAPICTGWWRCTARPGNI